MRKNRSIRCVKIDGGRESMGKKEVWESLVPPISPSVSTLTLFGPLWDRNNFTRLK